MMANLARTIVDRIIDDLNGRKGFDLDTLDDEIQDEIRNDWETIVEDALSDWSEDD